MSPDSKAVSDLVATAFNRGAESALSGLLKQIDEMAKAGVWPTGHPKSFDNYLIAEWKLSPELDGVSIPAACDFARHVVQIALTAAKGLA